MRERERERERERTGAKGDKCFRERVGLPVRETFPCGKKIIVKVSLRVGERERARKKMQQRQSLKRYGNIGTDDRLREKTKIKDRKCNKERGQKVKI